MSLDKAVPDQPLNDLDTFVKVRNFFDSEYKYDLRLIMNSKEFHCMKPRL